ncbi:ATPase [Rhodobacter sp. Har01]|uniref:ATP12 family chaperone protein n=1 Tax=Rhodobacter sp. Har01 TaxID=2883999 RepID=UPI001D08D2B7|nr:ATP12 family protein [Rhodobacter sp. Har01]MCB6180035.1 ATPase [Rhodobacter sp. Har01]
MTGWTMKRFWTKATANPAPGGFAIALDGRPVKTPAKAPLVVPTAGLAQAIAAEWNAQTGAVRPETMPFTRTANSAIDKLAKQHPEVVALLADYGGSDLLCYRAGHPAALAARQATVWDPILAWAADSLGAPLAVTEGVVPVAQPAASLQALKARIDALDPFRLAAFHDLVAIPGSLVLALAVTHGRIAPQAAWDASRIDEDWQIADWGADEEAAEAAALRREAFLHAHRFYDLCL